MKERKDAPPVVDGEDVWRAEDEHTARDVQRPRDGEQGMGIVAGFTTTGPTGSQGGRALHGTAPDDLPADQLGEEKEDD